MKSDIKVFTFFPILIVFTYVFPNTFFSACPVYDKIVSNGECKKYLSGIRIAQTPNQLTAVSEELKIFYKNTVNFVNVLLGAKNIEKIYIRSLLGNILQVFLIMKVL